MGIEVQEVEGMVPLIQVVIALVVIGLVLWVVQQIPLDAAIQKIIRVVVIVSVVLWLLYAVLLPLAGGGALVIRGR